MSVPTKEFLEREYVKLGKTFAEIEKESNFSKHQLIYWAKKLGIEVRRGGRRKFNLNGKKFGDLKVLREDGKKDGKHIFWLCACACGAVGSYNASALVRGQKSCYKCRSRYISKAKWGGFGEISGDFWYGRKRSAAVRNIDFEVSIEFAWKLFLKQERRCALSGIPLVFNTSHKTRSQTTASLDRKDSRFGYTESNVQWVHKAVNNMKSSLSDEEFIKWCSMVYSYRGKNAGGQS